MSAELVVTVVPVADDRAQWAMSQYFAELDARFEHGFDAAGALADAPASLDPPAGLFVIAELDGKVAGCGGITHVDAERSEIKRMWVNPAARGRGVGRRLLSHLEDLVGASGRPTVILDTNRVLLEAIAMYEAAGYRAIGRYNDNPYAHHWFCKDLG